MTFQDSLNVISSPESADGRLLCSSQTGLQLDLFGPEVAPVSHSVWPVKGMAPATIDISGQSSDVSLRTVSLQSSLENRLRARLDVNGSPEYVLTWKQWNMESGPPICALRASQRRTSDSDCGGWPTPDAQNFNDGADPVKHLARLAKIKETGINGNGAGLTLGITAQLAGWCTPTTRDHKGGANWEDRTRDGKPRPICDMTLPDQVHIGQIPSSSLAETGKRGVLNPDLPLWLMGYPEGWGSYAGTVTPSSRK